jgi:hypothetical protein
VKARWLMLATLAALVVGMMAVCGVALAQGGADVCVSNKGETKVQKGDSTCFSDSTSHAVATNDSDATAIGDSNKANAHNDSSATSVGTGNKTQANNDSCATSVGAGNKTQAQNGEHVNC